MPSQPPRPVSREEVREVDRRAITELGVPGIVLMENAGLGLTDCVEQQLGAPGQTVGIVVGAGNNGGDGLVLARHLTLRGHAPRVAYCGARARARRESDAGINLTIAERAGVDIVDTPDGPALEALLREWGELPLLVDALFGTGLSGELREPGRGLVEALDRAGPPKLAVDIPSGLDCDLGAPLGAAVRAVRTVTFVQRKLGFDRPGAADYTGRVDVVSIGCPAQAWSHVG